MRTLGRVICSVGAVALLAACGGSQLLNDSATIPQNFSVRHAPHGKSWMLPGATRGDLIYAVEGCTGTCVLTYPKGKLVGELYSGGGAAVCSDAAGNVFITLNDTVSEWAHGGKSPIATLAVPGYDAAGCSVDRNTNDLAVVFRSSGGNDIAVFPAESGSPTTYSSKLDSSFCGYDNAGNLFISGYKGHQPAISEIAHGERTATILSISGTLGTPGEMQWDGSYMTYENRGPTRSDLSIARLSISGSVATVVGTTSFHSHMRYVNQTWIYKGTILVPYGKQLEHINRIGLFAYPDGGFAKSIFKFPKGLGFGFNGVAVSVGAKP